MSDVYNDYGTAVKTKLLQPTLLILIFLCLQGHISLKWLVKLLYWYIFLIFWSSDPEEQDMEISFLVSAPLICNSLLWLGRFNFNEQLQCTFESRTVSPSLQACFSTSVTVSCKETDHKRPYLLTYQKLNLHSVKTSECAKSNSTAISWKKI